MIPQGESQVRLIQYAGYRSPKEAFLKAFEFQSKYRIKRDKTDQEVPLRGTDLTDRLNYAYCRKKYLKKRK